MPPESATTQTTTPVRGRDSRKKRSPAVLAACNRCRRAKIRCDGIRPSCRGCQSAGAACRYDTESSNETRAQAVRRRFGTVQATQAVTRDSLAWLISQEPNIALAYLQQLRQSQNPVQDLITLVAAQRAGRLSPQIPAHETLISTSDLINDSSAAQLVAEYPDAFPWIPQTEQPSHALPPSLDTPSLSTREPRSHSHLVYPREKARLSPQDSTEYYPRLRKHLNIDHWTAVDIGNDLAAQLISTYIAVEHPIYGFFDADLFLDDLLNLRYQFCSPLLVHALLFWACCTYGSVCPGASAFAQSLLGTAQSLLDGERNNSTAVNVAALMILSIGTICFGEDQLGREYLIAGVKMAEELSLIGERRQSIDHFRNLTPEALSMLNHAAWGAFNFSSVYLMHFHDANARTYTKSPPLLAKPSPRAPVSEDTQGQSSSTQRRPAHDTRGSSFPYFCDFWCIAHEIGSVLYASPTPIRQRVPLAFVESKLHRLLEWARGLPREMKRSARMAHNVAEMHICYHATIMDLFRPFINHGKQLLTPSTDSSQPESIFALSFGHLRVLSEYYYTTFAGLPPAHSVSWVHGPLYVAPAILRYDRSDGWEAAFLSCIDSCSYLFQSHRGLEGFLRALLGMGVAAGALSIKQAAGHLDRLLALRDHGNVFRIPGAGFIVDQDLATENRDEAVGHVLAQKFDEMLFADDPLNFD